eukprot:TRINITY_DN8589_c1_g4_i1.p1 TRINITY_DN8589_c1_g4~~TRINITY_DN8589_c1_g4_i1.p1  ORF type:complete len:216 (+),score=48.02 TRINITY_DN8589_c1_g4_i1:366-1013(+)
MANGLLTISNQSYMPYGNGRDWFFIGDYRYRNGCKTPDANQRKKAAQASVPAPPRGPPREVVLGKAAFAATPTRSGSGFLVAATSVKRWRRHNESATRNDALRVLKGGGHHDVRWRAGVCSRLPEALRNGGESDVYVRSAQLQPSVSDADRAEPKPRRGIPERSSSDPSLPLWMPPPISASSWDHGQHVPFDKSAVKLTAKHASFSHPTFPPGSF